MNEKIQEKIKQFLATLQDEMYKQRMSPKDFCREMEISRPTLYNWVSGRTKMSYEDYLKALEVLGIKEELITK